MRQPLLAAFLLTVLLSAPVVVVCSAPGAGVVTSRQLTSIASNDTAQRAPPDPANDVIGWESGYWYNESIDIDQSDGLSESELDAFLARSMARVEYIRHLEFTEPVPVEFVRRGELSAPLNDTFGLSTSEQLWEALFLYGEDANASRAVGQAQRGVVLGYAAEEGSDHIVIADSNPQKPTVSGGTLIHELTHMLQDQRFDLGRQRYQRSTLDGEFAKDGLVEGAAAYVTSRYSAKCQGRWQCVSVPSSGGSVERPAPDRFYRLTYFPYTAGERYVRALVEREGWSAVTDAHESPPLSTEQVIHSNRDEREQPVQLTFTETARNGWVRLDERPETIGEEGINTLFWRRLEPTTGRGNYTSRFSSGWGNDRLYAYTNGDTRGYVWKTIWDSNDDAREFREAYVAVLEGKGATQQGPHTWRIENGPFADSFSIRHTGTTVTIVNGPTVSSLSDIRPNNTSNTTRTNPEGTTTTTTGPGFGGLLALVALVFAGIGLYSRG